MIQDSVGELNDLVVARARDHSLDDTLPRRHPQMSPAIGRRGGTPGPPGTRISRGLPYGEVVLSVPVAASTLRFARQAIGMYMSQDRSKIDNVLKGKISGPLFSAIRFESKGEIALPAEMFGPAQ